MTENAENFSIDCAAIVGVGLIGGSVGRALIERKIASRVVGIGRNLERLQQAQASNSITDCSTELEHAVGQADVVVICTPVERIVDFAVKAIRHCSADTLITDAGSTKRTIVEAVHIEVPQARNFVGSHPMAGSEKGGEPNADSKLFVNRPAIVTPSDFADSNFVVQCEAFWKSIGANAFTMEAAKHDQVVSSISHLPHVLASILAANTPESMLPFASTGWLDTTRVASGDVELWRQILSQNHDLVLESLDDFAGRVASFRDALKQNDFEHISKVLQEGKQRRDVMANRHSPE